MDTFTAGLSEYSPYCWCFWAGGFWRGVCRSARSGKQELLARYVGVLASAWEAYNRLPTSLLPVAHCTSVCYLLC